MPSSHSDKWTTADIERGKWLHGELTPVSSKYRPAIRAAVKLREDFLAEATAELCELGVGGEVIEAFYSGMTGGFDEQVMVSVDEAMARLNVIEDYDPGDGPKPCVHTFRTGFCLMGAHWSVEDARAAFEKWGAIVAGPAMTGMGHGLAIVDDTGPVFFETKAKD